MAVQHQREEAARLRLLWRCIHDKAPQPDGFVSDIGAMWDYDPRRARRVQRIVCIPPPFVPRTALVSSALPVSPTTTAVE